MSSRKRKAAQRAPRRGVRSAEQLLIDALPELTNERILCASIGRAQLAVVAAATSAETRVACCYLDTFLAESARRHVDPGLTNLSIHCTADFPEGEVDLVALPFPRGGESELARDLLQIGHDRLRDGGRLLCASENSRDTWLHDELRAAYPKVTRTPFDDGVVYAVTRTGPLKKPRDFTCDLAFRDRDRIIHAVTRPGVFSHRRIDVGARALIQSLHVEPGMRVLEIGCGAGVVSFAAACRAEGVEVLALDSNARAIDCTRRGAELNGLTNVRAELDAEVSVPESEAYDLVVANPPYFSNYRIAKIFLRGGLRAMRAAGRIQFVAKNAAWYVDQMQACLDDVTVETVRDYVVITGQGRKRSIDWSPAADD